MTKPATTGTLPVIALLTDFGLEGWYVGVMKGVIKGICPHADIVDISHQVAPHSIIEGALMLAAAHAYFPSGTIFVVVVDPGVGTAREPVVVRIGDQYFIAPNNGVLSMVAQRVGNCECRRLSNERYFLPTVSTTFHGRNVFAPAAAHLAAGVPWKDLAPHRTELFGLATTAASFDSGIIEGNIIYFDHFGNAITNISSELFTESFGALKRDDEETPLAIHVEDWVIPIIRTTYGEADVGEVVAYWGSIGNLEIGINHGNAHSQLHLKLLDKVSIQRHDKGSA